MENKDCPCKKKKCERHGMCDECRAHHAESKRQRPVACEKKKMKVLCIPGNGANQKNDTKLYCRD